MKSILIVVFVTIISTQALAFSVKFDRCAAYGNRGYYYDGTTNDSGYRDDSRAYRECTRYYEEHSFFVEGYRSYTCDDTEFVGSYRLDVAGEPDNVLIRESLAWKWVTPDYKIYEEQGRAILVNKTASGGLDIIATCHLNK